MNKPFKLKPAAKDYLWGGTRLKTVYGKDIDIDPLAETWECSTHPDGPSIVASGEYEGKTLTEVLQEHPEYLGSRALSLTGGKPELPILVKLIDAAKDLSVQVHPDDEYALKNENSLGKTEMWYVLQATPGANLVHGFNRDVIPEEVCRAVEDGNIEQLLNYVPVKTGDTFYIEAGTVHAIGAGALVAEIQENSNITYRLYDYNRIGKDGKKRELHVEKSLKVANFTKSVFTKDREREIKQETGFEIERLKQCKYFSVDRVKGKTIEVGRDEGCFHALLFLSGNASIEGNGINVKKGETIFIPAGAESLVINGDIEFLDITC
jgi:mannose-6-phosphate isomerase